MGSTNPEDLPLYKLWQLARSKNYCVRFNGDTIDLVPLSKQGDTHTVPWHPGDIVQACEWLKAQDTQDISTTETKQSDKFMTNT